MSVAVNDPMMAFDTPTPTDRPPSVHPALAELRVLVVDDEPFLLKAVQRGLESFGCAVRVAPSLALAFELLAVDQFDVVLTDLRLGDDSGLTLLEALADCAPASVALMMSGDAAADEQKRAVVLGAVKVIRKPFTRSALKGALEAALEVMARRDSVVRETDPE